MNKQLEAKLRKRIRVLVENTLREVKTQTIELDSNNVTIDERDLKEFLRILKNNRIKYEISLPF